jgi:glycosyltransferase involved in cell wall biosynthesis
MQLWILNHYAATPDMAGGTRHIDLGGELVQRGCDVTILASSFAHKERRQTGLATGETWKLEEVEGVKFVWLRTFPYKGNDWRRVVNMVSYAFQSYWLGLRLPRLDERVSEPDVVIGSSVHLLAVLSAYFLARHFGARFVMEVRDLWPQTLVDMGALSEQHLFTRLLRGLERFLYQRAERIIVLLPKAGEYIASLGIATDKVQWIPNGVNLSRFPVREPRGRADGQFTVTYIGAHGYANNLDVILRAARDVQQRGYAGIHFVFVGDGPEKPRLMAYCEELTLMNTEFRDPVAKRSIPTVLAESEALILVLRNVDVFKYGISSNKLFDYLASGKPVLFACNASNNIVEEAQCGLSVPPDAPEALADAIISLYEMSPEKLRAMGERGRTYVERHHDCAVLAERLQQCIEDLG